MSFLQDWFRRFIHHFQPESTSLSEEDEDIFDDSPKNSVHRENGEEEQSLDFRIPPEELIPSPVPSYGLPMNEIYSHNRLYLSTRSSGEQQDVSKSDDALLHATSRGAAGPSNVSSGSETVTTSGWMMPSPKDALSCDDVPLNIVVAATNQRSDQNPKLNHLREDDQEVADELQHYKEAERFILECQADQPTECKDCQWAVHLLTTCHHQVMALALLGFAHEFGLGVAIDYPTAERYYKLADEASRRASGDSSEGIKEESFCAFAVSRLAFWRRCGRPNVRFDLIEAKMLVNLLNAAGPLSLRWLIKAANVYKNPSAQYCLGNCYQEGMAMLKDDKVALSYYLKAAARGHPRAQAIAGYCYGEKCGVEERNYETAVRYFQMAGAQGDAVAIYNLGYYHEMGNGVPRDLEKAFQLYDKSAKLGYAYAQSCLGFCYEDGVGCATDKVKAVHWYHLAAKQNFPWAQCNLGYCLQNGLGCQIDEQSSAYWYLKAAIQGFARAQHNYGFCLQNGLGVNKNENEALVWYRRSAEQGNLYAFHSLGYCYQRGIGVQRDYVEAAKWFTMAADRGHAPAMLSLGYSYQAGTGVEVNPEKAMDYFRQSAEKGNATAMQTLAQCYEMGCNQQPVDYVEAFKWYLKAAEEDCSVSLLSLGDLLLRKFQVLASADPPLINHAADYKRVAYNYIKKAAKLGNAKAYFRLGEMWETGTGTPNVDLYKAFRLYDWAARRDVPAAMYAVGRCLEYGIPGSVDVDLDSAYTWYQSAYLRGDIRAAERIRHLIPSPQNFIGNQTEGDDDNNNNEERDGDENGPFIKGHTPPCA